MSYRVTNKAQKIQHILESVDYSRSLPEPLRGNVNTLFRESYMVLLRTFLAQDSNLCLNKLTGLPVFVIATIILALLLVLRQKNIAI